MKDLKIPNGLFYEKFSIQGRAKIGLQLYVKHGVYSSVLLFINYYIIYLCYHCKLTFAHPCILLNIILFI